MANKTTTVEMHPFQLAYMAIISRADQLVGYGFEGEALDTLVSVVTAAKTRLAELTHVLDSVGDVKEDTGEEIKVSLTNLNAQILPFAIYIANQLTIEMDAIASEEGFVWSSEETRKKIEANAKDAPHKATKSMFGFIAGLSDGGKIYQTWKLAREGNKAKAERFTMAKSLAGPKNILGGKVGKAVQRAEEQFNRLDGAEQNEVRRRASNRRLEEELELD